MSHAWHLVRRPRGMPVAEDFALRPVELPPLGDGMLRVANRWLSVDPYMRGRMNDAKSYAAPFDLDAPMQGGAIGEVIESRAPGFAPGELVLHFQGWRDAAVLTAGEAQKLPPIAVDPQAFLGQFGMPGMTAWFGLFDVASAQPGDTVFVSAAAGAVGSTVVQLAKARGMTVIGSAGGADKCAWVRAIGADAVIDYKSGTSVLDQLNAAAPEGIDVYFDNVGGEHLDAALATARLNARFAECGMIEMYNTGAAMPLRYAFRIVGMRIRIKGFIVSDFMDRAGEFYAGMAELAPTLKRQETVVEGLDNMPQAFLGLFSGANMGKMLVRV